MIVLLKLIVGKLVAPATLLDILIETKSFLKCFSATPHYMFWQIIDALIRWKLWVY